MTCKECLYFKMDGKDGHCVRYPPVSIPVPVQTPLGPRVTVMSQLLPVSPTHWCGECKINPAGILDVAFEAISKGE